MKIPWLALSVAFLAIAAFSPARAHTAVLETSIADNTTFSASPDSFTVTFSAATGLVNVTLTGAAGQGITLHYTPPRTREETFTIPLPVLAPGAYTISWRAISQDGHVMPGAVRFTVAR